MNTSTHLTAADARTINSRRVILSVPSPHFFSSLFSSFSRFNAGHHNCETHKQSENEYITCDFLDLTQKSSTNTNNIYMLDGHAILPEILKGSLCSVPILGKLQ
ncbi:hypothetical protein EUGRSUZ_F01168 [Eucalyptus grandis]|uniref:Uncharacterized protein n=2 Tax=Eucalyptus grandis TaxID=71139 RepID=A0ACC3KF86_EUCGR|nr:hypothetical protein EUGRSUZ_F01168 [Eucalyptus grandis]